MTDFGNEWVTLLLAIDTASLVIPRPADTGVTFDSSESAGEITSLRGVIGLSFDRSPGFAVNVAPRFGRISFMS